MSLKALGAVALSTAVLASSVPAQAATNFFRPIIMKAIDSPEGTAAQTFAKDEPWVRLMRQKLGTEGPVTVTAKVIKRWSQPGCARVETSFKFHSARFDDKRKEMIDEGFNTEVNTCRDGQPPVEAMDLRALRENMTDEPSPQQSRVIRHQIVMEKDGRVRAVPVEPAAPMPSAPKK